MVPPRGDPRAPVTAMTIIVAVVVFWALFVIGVLVGISLHREATRRRTGRLHRAEMRLEGDRGRGLPHAGAGPGPLLI
jgi:hypothetical protein